MTRIITKNQIIILMYHGFIEKDKINSQKGYATQLEIDKFEKQLHYLKSNHSVIPIELVVEHYKNGENLPDYPVVITVDDGYESFYRLALPLLVKANLPATIFLTTNFIDQKEMLWPDRLGYALRESTTQNVSLSVADESYRFALHNPSARAESQSRLIKLLRHLDNTTRITMLDALEQQTGSSLHTTSQPPQHLKPMRWDQVVKAQQTGLISVGSHTVSHPVLTSCTVADMRDELRLSKASIEWQLGQPCELFCYPFGTPNDFSPVTRELVKEAGYASALTTVVGVNHARADIYALKRYMVDNRATWHGFVARVNGLLSAPHSLAKWGLS